MADDSSLDRLLRTTMRRAGERFEDLRRATSAEVETARDTYRIARTAATLPTDDQGRVRIVCRRHAERRATALDDAYRPECFEAGNPDCEGCVEDLYEGQIETWDPVTDSD